jgi:hypothetical protein
MSDPQKKIINSQEFYGGKATDDTIGPPASFGYSQAMDFRKNPSKLTALPGARKIGTLQDLPLNIVQVPNGTRYVYGDQGNLYKIDTSNVLTYLSKLPTGSDGLLYRSDTDAMYMATQTDLRRYYPLSGTPTFDVIYGNSRSTDTNAYRTGGTLTCAIPIAIDEGQACYFQPDIEPFYSMKVNITSKGTGDWTLTLHDGLNTVLATSTVTNANITSGSTEFVFSSQIRALVKPNARTYHFHLTSTVAGGTVACTTANNLNTADFELWAYRLVDTVNGLHPVAQFQQFTLIGNGNCLAVWEPLTDSNPPNNEFQRHRLVFPPGFEVCGIAVTDEFAVIACEKRSTDGAKDFQEGKLFTWDGTAKAYNQIIDVDGGAPQGIYSHENIPFMTVNGTLQAWAGGKTTVKVRTIANTDTEYSDITDNTTVYPNMMATRNNILLMGYPSVTNNQSVEHGVYSWGAVDKNYSSSFGYSYLISTGTKLQTGTNNLKIGCVRNFGDELYIGWQDGAAFGIDIVDNLSNPAPVFKFRARKFNAGAVFKKKMAVNMAITTHDLPAGVTITPVYRIDGGVEVSGTPMTSGDQVVLPIPSQFREIIYGFDGTCEGTASPDILSIALEWDALLGQRSF